MANPSNLVGFLLRTFLFTSVYCIWEVQEGKTAADFQAFIDGPDGTNMGMDTFSQTVYPIMEGANMGPVARQFA